MRGAFARRQRRWRVLAEEKHRFGRKGRAHNAATQWCVEAGTLGGRYRARTREEIATMMRRCATTGWHMEPHDGAIVLALSSAATGHDVRHQGMTIFDGVCDVFEVNCLICANRCGHRRHTVRPSLFSMLTSLFISSQPTFAAANGTLERSKRHAFWTRYENHATRRNVTVFTVYPLGNSISYDRFFGRPRR